MRVSKTKAAAGVLLAANLVLALSSPEPVSTAETSFFPKECGYTCGCQGWCIEWIQQGCTGDEGCNAPPPGCES